MKTVTRREYKDRLFTKIFTDKENALSLYNAVNGTDYQNAEDLELYTIDDTVYMGMKNDVSFLFSDEMNLFEQQSTFNPNMPIRALMYLGRQYDKFIELNDVNVYSQKLQTFPAPRCIMFYNGDAKVPARSSLRLTDAFGKKRKNSSVELTVDVYNINYGENEELLNKCMALHDYSLFVDAVKSGRRHGMSLDDAVEEAMKMAAKQRLLKGYFSGHRAEVKNMVLTEYDEERVMRGFYKDGVEDGLAKGLEAGRREANIEAARNLKLKGVAIEIIAECTGLSVEEIKAL